MFIFYFWYTCNIALVHLGPFIELFSKIIYRALCLHYPPYKRTRISFGNHRRSVCSLLPSSANQPNPTMLSQQWSPPSAPSHITLTACHYSRSLSDRQTNSQTRQICVGLISHTIVTGGRGEGAHMWIKYLARFSRCFLTRRGDHEVGGKGGQLADSVLSNINPTNFWN